MKKLLIAGGLVALGIAAFLFNSGTTTNNSASASTEDKVVSSSKKDDDHEESWLEHFIKTHKNHFSKTIRK